VTFSSPRHHDILRLTWLSALLALLLTPVRLGASSEEELRISAGLRLFRYVLAADLDLASKTESIVDGEGRTKEALLLVVFYTDDERRAKEVAAALGETAIRDLPVEAVPCDDPRLAQFDKRQIAGIFVSEAPSNSDLAALIDTAVSRKVVAYSPFEGHVEKGILAGLSIEAQVRPFVNAETLRASGIQLKPFFLKVAKVYG